MAGLGLANSHRKYFKNLLEHNILMQFNPGNKTDDLIPRYTYYIPPLDIVIIQIETNNTKDRTPIMLHKVQNLHDDNTALKKRNTSM